MGDELQTAVIFTAKKLEDKNVMLLIPQRIVVGESNEDTSYFYSFLDNKEYQNADDAVREGNKICFYDIKTIEELKDYYDTKDLNFLLEMYFEDLYNKVYYYDLSNEDEFENYFMKKSSIEEFNNKYDLKFSYHSSSEKEEQKELPEDPIAANFGNIKYALDKNILFQNKAKNKLLNTLYNNFVLNDTKSNIIISGPPGVGKTEALKLLADYSTQPVLYTKFAPSFIDDAKEYLDSLLLNCYYLGLSKQDEVISKTIIIDDFDKDFNYSTAIEVIDEITKFMRDGKRFVRYSSNTKAGIMVDSSNITFIICGNFDKVKREKIIPIEFFTDNTQTSDVPLSLNRDDLTSKYGFYESTIDFFDTHIDFEPLNLDKTKKIIVNSNNSLLQRYRKQLKQQGITIDISDKTIDLISERVYSKTKNIKNINQVITDIFQNIITTSFTLAEGTSILVDEKIVDDHNCYTLKKRF